jgi:hemin uptake protein HemP
MLMGSKNQSFFAASNQQTSAEVGVDVTGAGEIDSVALFADRDTLVIHHQGERYCLRRTRQNRLILTK